MSLINRQALLDKIEITPFEDYGDYITVRDLVAQFPTSDCKTEPQKKEVEWVYNKRERLWYPYSNGELLFNDKPTTQTETQNSNLTFEKRTMRDCYSCKRYKSDDACVECRYEPKDEPQTDVYDYKGNGKWERSE